MRPVKDSGYILGGYSYSQGENDKTDTFIGNCDYWIVRIDANGNRKWDKTIGGINSDYETDVQQTIDRGFILGGYSNSPVSFNKTETRKGVLDYWIVKTDSNGVVKWDKTYGGTKGDYLSSIAQTADSGYIMGGTSSSNISSDKSENSKGLEDYWIVKLDSAGKIVWDKTYGGSRVDRLSVIKEISRDEYIIGGTSNSPVSGDKTDKTVGGKGFNDYWIWSPYTAEGDEKVDGKGGRYKDPNIYHKARFLPDSVTRGKYGDDIYTEKILNFIDSNTTTPFFIYYPICLVHPEFCPTPDNPDFAGFD